MKPQPHGASASSANPNGLPKFNLFMVLSALRCWWHIALPLGLVLGACAAVAVFYLSKPVYTASAWLEIKEKPPNVMTPLFIDDPRKFVANQVELIRSPPVLDPVITIREVRNVPELVEEEDPSLFLRKNLSIQAKGGSELFVIEFTSEDPVGAARIVNEVAKSYLALQQRHGSQVHDRMVEVLQEQLQAREVDIKRMRSTLEEKTKKLSGKEPFALKKSESRGQTQNRLQQLDSQLLAATLERVTLQAQIQAETELSQKESFVPPEELVLSRVRSNPKLAALELSLADDRAKLALHEARSVNLAANKLHQELAKKIADDETALKSLTDELKAQAATEMEKTARLKRQFEIEKLQSDLFKIETTIKFLESQLTEERHDREEVAGDTVQLEWDLADIQQATDLRDAITNRILSMQMERRAPERVSMFREATVPVRPDEEVPYKKMLMAAFAALALPFGAAVGIEILFGRVGSRQQLETSGGIMVVGEITTLPRRIKSRRQEAEPQREVQLYEESINGLRTYLTLIESARGRRVLAVTSSISREGKTSLAAQLAVSVANSSGKPTLLIDGDMRSPDLHRIFDVECGPGLADVLAGKCPVEEVIETSFSDRLHVLTAGHLTVNPHQLTGSGEFERLIEKLRGLYDHIIIDTPPILPASEALLMARASDAAILCVRRDYSRVDQVSEAHSRLVAAGVKVAGAVLNGVPSQAYAFRYGSYYYSKARPAGPDTDASGEPTIVA